MKQFNKKVQAFIKRQKRFKLTKKFFLNPADIKSADYLLKTMSLKTKEDYFLFYSCIVLLSSANKKFSQRKQKSYVFKNFVQEGIECAIVDNVDFLKFYQIKDKKGEEVTYVKVCGLQFSFHNAGVSPKMNWAKQALLPQYEKQEWEFCPLQNFSTKLFNFALSQGESLSRVHFDGTGRNPKQIVKENRQEELKNKQKEAQKSRQIEKEMEL